MRVPEEAASGTRETACSEGEHHMCIRPCGFWLSILVTAALGADASAGQAPTRDIKVISRARARAMADACIALAAPNKQVVAMAVLEWSGNLIASHAMEGAAANA